MEHKVWHKNKAPTRALKDETQWEAVYELKPNLDRETVFGSGIFVTFPPELGKGKLPNIHGVRGWMGYFCGFETEAVYKVYSPQRHRAYQV